MTKQDRASATVFALGAAALVAVHAPATVWFAFAVPVLATVALSARRHTT